MTENEDKQAKEPSEGRLRYLARYGAGKPQILQAKGRVVAIYFARGFVEIDKETFDAIAREMKGLT